MHSLIPCTNINFSRTLLTWILTLFSSNIHLNYLSSIQSQVYSLFHEHGHLDPDYSTKPETTSELHNQYIFFEEMTWASYGFTFDLTLTAQKNVEVIFCDLSVDFYLTQASNFAFHNRCVNKIPPVSIKSLFGLSHEFIPDEKLQDVSKMLTFLGRTGTQN